MTSTLDSKGLVELGRYLKRVGYAHIAVTPVTHGINNDRAGSEQARALRDILGWSRPFSSSAVSREEFELLSRAGILVPEGMLWRSTVRWASLQGHLYAHSAYPTLDEDAVFFGPDTYRFARMIQGWFAGNPGTAGRIRSAVDIGCGSGAGALIVADHCPAADVAAVDINAKALQLAQVNVELAQANRVSVLHSNLLHEVEGQFELIIANPPYMLDDRERAYRHGGGNLGEGLSLRIIDTALQRLEKGGTLLLYTGVAIVEGRDPLRAFVQHLDPAACRWSYEEMDPDVFSDELLKPGYENVERIAAVALTLTRA